MMEGFEISEIRHILESAGALSRDVEVGQLNLSRKVIAAYERRNIFGQVSEKSTCHFPLHPIGRSVVEKIRRCFDLEFKVELQFPELGFLF